MKLALDEHYSSVIAARLCERGHDVIPVHDRPELEGLKDRQLFPLLAAERRAIVTENWADYQEEIRTATAAGRDHYGVVFTSRNRLPRGKRTIGLFIRVLDDFLTRHPGEDALRNDYRWLPEPEQVTPEGKS